MQQQQQQVPRQTRSSITTTNLSPIQPAEAAPAPVKVNFPHFSAQFNARKFSVAKNFVEKNEKFY